MKAADFNLLDGKKEADRIAAVCGERQVEKKPFFRDFRKLLWNFRRIEKSSCI